MYQNETRLIGRPTLPVIITETGWSRDFCTEEERAGWQVSAWEAWYDDPQLLAACPFNLEGPRYATPHHSMPQHSTPRPQYMRLSTFTLRLLPLPLLLLL